MSEREDSIRRRAGKYCLLGANDALYLLRRLDRERDVVERERKLTQDDDVCNGSTSGYSFWADAEAESRREKPDLWDDDGIPCADASCAPAQPAPVTTTATAATNTKSCTYDESAPLTLTLPPEQPCPTCGGQMGYQRVLVPSRRRCFRCEPEPSLWREGPPPREVLFWLWRPENAPQLVKAWYDPGHLLWVNEAHGYAPWQPDWRWLPLEPPAAPEVKP